MRPFSGSFNSVNKAVFIFSFILFCWYVYTQRKDSSQIIEQDNPSGEVDIVDPNRLQLMQLLKFYNLNLSDDGRLLNSNQHNLHLFKAHISKRRHNKRRYCRIWRNLQSVPNLTCVRYKTLTVEIPICIYSKEQDNFISSSILNSGTWEPDLVSEMGKLMLSDPNIHFVDIGANIGTYTLYMATLGRKVVAVEPFEDNLVRLHESLRLSKLLGNVTLIHNAVSDERKAAVLQIPTRNIGGAYLESNLTQEVNTRPVKVNTILLSDLIEVIDFHTVALKIDAEGHELNILKGASEFFQTLNVKYLMIEWLQYRYKKEGKQVIDLLLNKGLFPFSNITQRTFLDPNSYYLWPDNIFWMKR